ncbi:predicted protein [Uncinocarpus reesii 1704]|uniref:Parasitic phase-specific protein PSP-1 n=1 Tax=Uncinocarpus reesii (strain UAMH 1704) TaxID=336963 RepID=C4JN65_UNCRE|nr:uncharacterized protein UREG_04273 [Uncinocarpus reesii 1704]EEP79427.1 predicted protein [Uncinocarpus reesii 1704]
MSDTAALLATLLRREIDPEQCTFDICSIEDSWYKYRPSLAANATLTAIFALSAIAFLVQGIVTRRFVGFTIAMGPGDHRGSCGLHWSNPHVGQSWKETSLGSIHDPNLLPHIRTRLPRCRHLLHPYPRIVTIFGVQNSRIPALWYPRIFIPCDIIALILQGAGGGIASASEDSETSDLGKDIMIAGLVAQVVTLTAFIILAIDFSVRAWLRMRTLGDAALDPRHAQLRGSFMFRAFLAALGVATLTIFVRCAYRVAELSEGWDGPLMREETLFIVLEGVMIVIAVVALNVFNPVICFKSGYDKDISQEMKGRKSESESESEGNVAADEGPMEEVRWDRV